MRAQGFVHAQERFFEMDVRRHVTAGRLSELFGETALETDEFIRTMGWRRVAEQELALIKPETRAALEAYADGVNAYLDSRSPTELAVEYTVLRAGGLDYRPEPWTPVDSLAWLKAMAWDLRGNMTDEIDRVLALADHTPAEVAQLYPPYPYDQNAPIVRQGAVVDGVFEQDATQAATRLPQRPAYAEARGTCRRLRAGLERLPGPARPRRRHRQQRLGGRRRALLDRRAAARQRPAPRRHACPGVWMQVGLHCRDRSTPTARSTSRASRSPASRA